MEGDDGEGGNDEKGGERQSGASFSLGSGKSEDSLPFLGREPCWF